MLWSYSAKRMGQSIVKYYVLFIFDAFVPVLGFCYIGIFCGLSFIFELVYDEDDGSNIHDLPLGESHYDDYADEKRALIKSDDDEENEDIFFNALQIQPYLEILDGENLPLKINAIEKLSYLKGFQSVPILKIALDSTDYEVRYFANNVLIKIEQEFLAKIDVSSELIEEKPQEFSNYNERASLYLETYLSGILDKTSELFFLEKSLFDYLTSLSLKQGQSKLYVSITHIYLLLGKDKELQQIATLALNSQLEENDKAKIHFYLAESYFRQGFFSKTLDSVKSTKESSLNYPLIDEVTSWWGDS